MKIDFSKYQGAGNDFIILDNRNNDYDKIDDKLIALLCDRRFGIGADGLMLLEKSENADFKMIYFNSDGKQGTMCGNGGRCIVAFANKNKLFFDVTTFDAIDGLHSAHIINVTKYNITVKLKMADVQKPIKINNGFVLNTGSPHYVEFLDSIDELDILNKGKNIRNNSQYGDNGVNVNFATLLSNNELQVRTYERGVEDETYSCGTGVTASAIAAFDCSLVNTNSIHIKTKGGELSVSFVLDNNTYKDVYLQGDATFVFNGTIDI